MHRQIHFSLEHKSYMHYKFDVAKSSEMFGSKLALINSVL